MYIIFESKSQSSRTSLYPQTLFHITCRGRATQTVEASGPGQQLGMQGYEKNVGFHEILLKRV